MHVEGMEGGREPDLGAEGAVIFNWTLRRMGTNSRLYRHVTDWLSNC